MNEVNDRRFFLKTAGKITLTTAATLTFPSIISAKNRRPTIRVIGTHVTLQEAIRKKAESDLGINIEFYPGGDAEVLHKASVNPDSFDIYEQWSNSIRILWGMKAIQPIEIHRLKYWNEINSLSKMGKLTEKASIGSGDAPYKLLYAQKNGSLSSNPTEQISFMPYVHNVDSFGYDTRTIPKGIPYQTESWSWLLDDAHHGKVALLNEPSIGLFDAALAVQAKGLMQFKDIGNMSRKEIDHLFDILIQYKKKGHFRGVWSSVPQSIAWMKNKEVVLESMFSPAATTLNSEGIPCAYAAPKEGYRAWQGVMCLSRSSTGERKEAAYAFMNWWLSGWAGAFVAKQGYYISNPQRARQYMSKAEWDYWYMGLPASKPLFGTNNRLSVNKGEIRNGGSYQNRFEHIAVWNTVMEQYEYSLIKWNEFVLAQAGD